MAGRRGSSRRWRRATERGDGGAGSTGLLIAAIVGFLVALFREAVRRGREQGTPAYEEFRRVMQEVRGKPEGGSDDSVSP